MSLNVQERVSPFDSPGESSAMSGSRNIVFVRHGETDFNLAKRYQGCLNTPVLTELGYRQASATGKLLASVSFDAIYFSPLRRARQTLEAILEHLDAPPSPICSADLRELDLPTWEGVPVSRVESEFGPDYLAWKQNPDQFVMRTASGSHAPLQDVDRRVARFWDLLAGSSDQRTVLVISHGGTIRALVRAALGLPAKFHHRHEQFNGGLTWLQFDSNGQVPRIRMLNECSHLASKFRKEGTRVHLIPRCNASPSRIEAMRRELDADVVLHGPQDQCDLGAAGSQVRMIHVSDDSVPVWIKRIQSIQSGCLSRSHEVLAVATPKLILGLISQVLSGSEQLLSEPAINAAESITRLFLLANDDQLRLESVCPIHHPFMTQRK